MLIAVLYPICDIPEIPRSSFEKALGCFNTNLVFLPAYPWFLFPLVLWGVGLPAHYFVAFRWIQSENEQWVAQVEYRASKMHQAPESYNESYSKKSGVV